MGSAVKRIFLIGPSHAKYFEGAQFPSTKAYATPLGSLTVDTDAQRAMEAQCNQAGCPTGWMSQAEDEAEHSLELHTPFLAHLLHRPPQDQGPLSHISIVPIVVGDMDFIMEGRFGQALRSFFPSQQSGSGVSENLFCISTDFCHWGERFRYTYRFDKDGCPGDSIERMDREAMRILTANDCTLWRKYMAATQNTICGRHALSSLMQAAVSPTGGAPLLKTEFLHYSQSNRAANSKDSSVSYASALLSWQ